MKDILTDLRIICLRHEIQHDKNIDIDAQNVNIAAGPSAYFELYWNGKEANITKNQSVIRSRTNQTPRCIQ